MRSLRALAASSVGVGSIIAAGISGSALAQDAVQWRVEDGGNGHWYVLIAHAAEWDTARILAESKGGHLVTLTSAAEALFVRQLGSGTVWLGLRQNPTSPTFAEPAGGWEWITSEPLIYTNWRINENGQPNEPNNIDGTPTDVGTLDAPLATTWNDVPQVAQYPYLIEFDMYCNADGIVDYGQIRAGDLEDTNANNIPDCCEASEGCNPCLADIDESGAVNAVDLAAILSNWGTNGGKYPRADIDGNGDVDGADLAAVLSAWGPCP